MKSLSGIQKAMSAIEPETTHSLPQTSKRPPSISRTTDTEEKVVPSLPTTITNISGERDVEPSYLH
jgi:hypothetical protein